MAVHELKVGDNPAALARRPVGNTGLTVTTLGFGGLQVGDYWATMRETDAARTSRHADEAGVRYVDTAPQYGSRLSEHRRGSVLRSVPRDSLVLSTKAGRQLVPREDAAATDPARRGLPFRKVYDLSYDATMPGFGQSVHRLGLHRIDLVFSHDLDPDRLGDDYDATFKVGAEGCYRALDERRRAGVVKGVGAGLNDAPAACRRRSAGSAPSGGRSWGQRCSCRSSSLPSGSWAAPMPVGSSCSTGSWSSWCCASCPKGSSGSWRGPTQRFWRGCPAIASPNVDQPKVAPEINHRVPVSSLVGRRCAASTAAQFLSSAHCHALEMPRKLLGQALAAAEEEIVKTFGLSLASVSVGYGGGQAMVVVIQGASSEIRLVCTEDCLASADRGPA